MSWNTTIVLLLLSLSTLSIVYGAEKCCKIGRISRNIEDCENNDKILPKCDGARGYLNNEWGYTSHFKILNDSYGEYLENFALRYIVRSPHFCIGERRRPYSNKINPVAVTCTSRLEFYSDLNAQIDDSDNEEYYLSYYSILHIFLNFLSSLLLAAAFYVYYLILPVRQIEDDCLLNIAGSLTLSHVASLYNIFNAEGMLPDLCITSLYSLYYFILSGFTYYALFMYYLWKKYKIGASLEEAAVLKQFRIIGYGTPACLMIFINIHAHARKLYSEFKLETDCITHQILIEDIYIFGPIILAIGSNLYFWKNLENHLETRAIRTTEDNFNKKKIDSLLRLNQRLLFTLGLSWLTYILFNGTAEVYESDTFSYLGIVTDIITSGTGAFVALILVMSRGKVWKCVVLKYENYEWLKKWQPSDPEEISTIIDNGSVKFSGA